MSMHMVWGWGWLVGDWILGQTYTREGVGGWVYVHLGEEGRNGLGWVGGTICEVGHLLPCHFHVWFMM